MKSIISGAIIATAVLVCLNLNVKAKPISHATTIAVTDTGKMAKSKMSKMGKKKTSKMADGKMSKKKMAKDTTGKM